VSPNEADFNLRESNLLFRNLHKVYGAATVFDGLASIIKLPRLVTRLPSEEVRQLLETQRRLSLGRLPSPPPHTFIEPPRNDDHRLDSDEHAQLSLVPERTVEHTTALFTKEAMLQ
jgi:hypothetical protein